MMNLIYNDQLQHFNIMETATEMCWSKYPKFILKGHSMSATNFSLQLLVIYSFVNLVYNKQKGKYCTRERI